MKPESQIARIDELLGKTERIFRVAWVILAAILSAALWAASAQWSIADHERRLSSVEGDIKPMSDMLSRVKEHLGISAVTPIKPPPPSNVVWEEQPRKRERDEEEEQSTH